MQDASAMYLEAVEVMEDEGQETMALDIFRQAIGQAACLIHFLCSQQFACWEMLMSC